MEEILHHLGWLKPYKQWDNYHPWWYKILSINSINIDMYPGIFVLLIDSLLKIFAAGFGHCVLPAFDQNRDVPRVKTAELW